MAKVTIKRATMAAGKRVEAGQTIDLAEADARTLIALGKAVPVTDAPKAQNRDEEVTEAASKRASAKKKEKEG